MSTLAQGNHANLILKPGEIYRVSTEGTATVQGIYGAPATTDTLTAQSADYGPYDANAKLRVTATSGAATYSLLESRCLEANPSGLISVAEGTLFASLAAIETAHPGASNPRSTAWFGASWSAAKPADVISGVWTERGAGGGVSVVAITADTELSIAAHNGKILRLDAARTLTAPEGLGTAFSCLIEWPAGTTATIGPTGATQIQDTATPAGSTATRTRTHSNNPSGVVLKSTGTANVLSLSGS